MGVWALIFAVIFLPLVGVFAWSWYQPVELRFGSHNIAFGYGRRAHPPLTIWARGYHLLFPQMVPGVRYAYITMPPFLGGGDYWIWWLPPDAHGR